MESIASTRALTALSLATALTLVAPVAWGQQKIGVAARKVVVVDRLAASSKAKLVYAAKDAAITKGPAEDLDGIGVIFSLIYDDAAGSFLVFNGSFDGTSDWVSNDSKGAKFVNRIAPSGPTQVAKAQVREGKSLSLKAAGVGDLPLDVVGAGPPTATVSTLYCFSNGPDQACHCSTFSDCKYKVIAGGAGAKLVCKHGAADPTCNTSTPATTTTTVASVTTTTPSVTTTTLFDACGASGFPVCGGPCDGGDVCAPVYAPVSLGGNQCACLAPVPCGGTTVGVCPAGFACGILPPDGSTLCAPLLCSGGSGFPACGGSCEPGHECSPLKIDGIGDGFCVCAPAAACDSACGGYECPVGDVCIAGSGGSCSCGAP